MSETPIWDASEAFVRDVVTNIFKQKMTDDQIAAVADKVAAVVYSAHRMAPERRE